MSDDHATSGGAVDRSITLPDLETAKAVFGPLHRHVALIHDAFRDPASPRGQPTYAVDIRVSGNEVRLIGEAEAHSKCHRHHHAQNWVHG